MPLNRTSTRDALVVVYSSYTVLEQFVAGLDGRALVLSYGEQVPMARTYRSMAYWLSGEKACQLRAGGLAPEFAAAPADWLSAIDPQLLGRTVVTTTLELLPDDLGTLFIKPAGLKVPALIARPYSPGEFRRIARENNIPATMGVQYCRAVLQLDHEHRCVVLGGKVTTASPYLVAGVAYHPTMLSPRFDEAVAFARATATAIGADLPPACTMDVAWDNISCRWIVVETNNIWSAAPYGGDPRAVVEAITVGNTSGQGRWRWVPDDQLVASLAHLPAIRAVPADLASGYLEYGAVA
jgi:hypothetical protein